MSLLEISAIELSYRNRTELDNKLEKAVWCINELKKLGDTDSFYVEQLRTIRNKFRQAIDLQERREWEFQQLRNGV